MVRDTRKDQITGLKIDVLHPNGEIQRFKDDVVYLVEDTPTNFDVLRAMSYIPAKAPPLGNTYFQAQLSNKELIATRIFPTVMFIELFTREGLNAMKKVISRHSKTV